MIQFISGMSFFHVYEEKRMSEEKTTTTNTTDISAEPRVLFGRSKLFSSVMEVTAENVVDVIASVGLDALNNQSEEDYLYNYYKGKQPILSRVKKIRSDITHRIVKNHAFEIVSFHTGYRLGEPIQYVGRDLPEDKSQDLSRLNSYMLIEGAHPKNKELEDWRNICGLGYKMALPSQGGDAPFEIYVPDPRQTAVVYSTQIGQHPLCGLYWVVDFDDVIRYSVYTDKMYFEVKNSKVIKEEPHILGMIPIIEYPANSARLGSFEPALSLLDEINDIESNRADAIAQFVQSICLAINLDIPEGTTSQDIAETGILSFDSVDGNKGEFQILSNQLDQDQTQTLVDDLYERVLRIVGMPSQSDGSTSDSSNNGAVILKNGWENAEARAKDSEAEFKRSEQRFLRLIINICNKTRGSKVNLVPGDIDIKFTRRNYQDTVSKATVLTMLLQNEKVAPIDAFVMCGAFPDPDDACKRGLAWYESNKTEASDEAVTEEEEVIVDAAAPAP